MLFSPLIAFAAVLSPSFLSWWSRKWGRRRSRWIILITFKKSWSVLFGEVCESKGYRTAPSLIEKVSEILTLQKLSCNPTIAVETVLSLLLYKTIHYLLWPRFAAEELPCWLRKWSGDRWSVVGTSRSQLGAKYTPNLAKTTSRRTIFSGDTLFLLETSAISYSFFFKSPRTPNKTHQLAMLIILLQSLFPVLL